MSISGRTVAVVLGPVAVVLLAAGCGAASKTTTTAPTAHGQTVTIAPTSATHTTGSIASSNGASTAVLPASFVVNADDSLSPPLISGPVDTTIQLIVISRASHPLTVTVASHSLSVQPGGHASTRIQGLKAGRYPIAVNGRGRAALVVGAQPGP
jgi:hypothetical protein